RPGFDTCNIDLSKRREDFQEFVNNSVLSKQLRVLFMPNKENLVLKDVAEMSYGFWDYFLKKGRLNLAEYNKVHKTSIKVIRGQNMKRSDLENLGLFLRYKIRKLCSDMKKPWPEILVRGSYVIIKNKTTDKRFKSTILAITLGWDYHDWHGAPIKSLLTPFELEKFEDGAIKWGSLKMESILSFDTGTKTTTTTDEPKNLSRKRESGIQEVLTMKKPRNDGQEVE
ncbi:hypothetical protein OSTOST_14096, partial [Ostertagia ostertagi]